MLTLLRNARLVLSERILGSGSLLIEDGQIARVIEDTSAASVKADSIIDLNGATLFPGFIDIHIHGAVGVDVNSATAGDLKRVSELLARKGVTGWLPTLVPAADEEYDRAVAAISELMSRQASESRLQSADLAAEQPTKVGTLNTCAARVLGVHYEGPFVNSEQCGALHREHFRTFKTSADLDSLPTIEHDNAIHFTTVAPEIEGGIELIRELRRRGWIVSIGHTRATPDVLDNAKAAGAQHMTHFMNAMSPLHHRAPGPIGWGLLNDDVSLDVIADGVHLDPIMLKVLLRCMTPSRLALISDAIAATGGGDGDYEIWGEKITVANGRTSNARGSIAGSVITMLDAVKMMLSLGASECDVTRMASSNPARLLGIYRDCGSIEEGKRADLVALDSTGGVQLVITGGTQL
ncbi:MAG TPA: N-acetylglucosamine-6-phosphate deacetylase [Pyrinomonadaceae bacterium]|nr:N-acetylglucosamine-6-phosphate deacetylase [Pyrinomonadaceae bacterium]